MCQQPRGTDILASPTLKSASTLHVSAALLLTQAVTAGDKISSCTGTAGALWPSNGTWCCCSSTSSKQRHLMLLQRLQNVGYVNHPAGDHTPLKFIHVLDLQSKVAARVSLGSGLTA
jgi:hypothetical protein